MVIGVQEGEGLLLEHKEYGIDEFEIFGEVVHLRMSGHFPWAQSEQDLRSRA